MSAFVPLCSLRLLSGAYLLDEESFQNVDTWIEDVIKSRGDESMIALVGNKMDLEEER